jgi:hypothetical protein
LRFSFADGEAFGIFGCSVGVCAFKSFVAATFHFKEGHGHFFDSEATSTIFHPVLPWPVHRPGSSPR